VGGSAFSFKDWAEVSINPPKQSKPVVERMKRFME
jgi:hypothetical protein